MYMRWEMDIKETKMVKVGRAKRKFYVYDILASNFLCFSTPLSLSTHVYRDQPMHAIIAESHINLIRIYNDTAGCVVCGVTSTVWRSFLVEDQVLHLK